jgi:hypothetical protein
MRPAGLVRQAVLGLGIVWLTACASPSTPEQMSIAAAGSAPVAASRDAQNFRLADVSGGGSTNPIGLSDVSDDALRTALAASLHNLGYLASDDSKAGFVISADIVDLDRPTVALDPVFVFVPVDLSVTARIHYTVTPAGGGKPIFDDVVATTGTATASDALTPAARVQKANEAAIRLNIAAFVTRLQADRR